MNLEELQKKVNAGRARLDVLNSNLDKKTKRASSLKETLDNQKKASALLQDVASKTQEQLKNAVETVVQGCINLLFPGYEFKVNFVPKRGKVDAEFRVCKGGMEFDPLASNGGGVTDAITFSLRAGCLRLAGKRPILLLDEPFKYIRGVPRKELGGVLNTLVETMGVQVLMVSDVAGTDIHAEQEYTF